MEESAPARTVRNSIRVHISCDGLVLQQQELQQLSEDSGFESRAGLMVCPVGPTVRRLTTTVVFFLDNLFLQKKATLDVGWHHLALICALSREIVVRQKILKHIIIISNMLFCFPHSICT